MSDKTLAEVLPELRRPFTAAAIKMKPQATTGEGAEMKGLVSYYLDSRLVVERLNSVVGPEGWSDTYKLLCEGALAPGVGIPVECALTVLGVTKVDVGQIQPGAPDDKAWKSAYSDAFKRAGVKFSIGAYLYGGAGVWAPVKVNRQGKAQGFTPDGAAQARRSYAAWIASKAMKELYGEPLDHGDVLAEDLNASEGEPQAAGRAAGAQTQAVSQAVESEPASPSEDYNPFQPPETSGVTLPPDNGLPEDVTVHFGKNAGVRLGDLSPKSRQWYAENELRPNATAADRRLKAAAQTLVEMDAAA